MKQLFSLSSENGFLSKLISRTIWGVIVLVIIYPIFPNFIPYNPFEDFLPSHGSVLDWIITSRWFIAWGLFGAITHIVFNYNRKPSLSETFNKALQGEKIGPKTLKSAILRSIRAGTWEEIAFRWIIFLGSMPVIYISNWVFGGFLGSNYGIVHWVHMHITGPVANLFTFGFLHDKILHTCWYAGAALLASNSLFRDGHRYQGFFGYVHSWFAGMLLFYIMFMHGLFATIFIHFLYDLILMGAESITDKIRYGQLKLS